MEVKILHLYGDILNLYGEYGNVAIMKKHLEDQGMKVSVTMRTVGDEINLTEYDFIYMGCGTEKNLNFVMQDFRKYKKQLTDAIENDTVILATGNSFEMLGKKVGAEEGLGIFDYETILLKERITSDTIYSFVEENDRKEKANTTQESSPLVVGFINKMTEIYHNMSPLFQVVAGVGENKKNDFEGVKIRHFYGTHLIGPVLVKNPYFLKKLLIEIATKVDKNFQYTEKEYPYEDASYQVTLEELQKIYNEKSNK